MFSDKTPDILGSGASDGLEGVLDDIILIVDKCFSLIGDGVRVWVAIGDTIEITICGLDDD